MCTSQRWIYNHYSHKPVLVKCGRCEACRQEKANAVANRIRHHVNAGGIALFITLTYAPLYVPYVNRSDLYSTDVDLNVYRDASKRVVFAAKRGIKSRVFRTKIEVGSHPITTVNNPYLQHGDISFLPSLRNSYGDKIGVCLYDDFKKFIKRLREILPDGTKFSYYSCSEYGSVSKRPHFHSLLFIRPSDEEVFRRAIVKAWPYADRNRTSKFIEIARNAAGYVASYVSGNYSLPSLFQTDKFKPSHAYSKGFGLALCSFTLDSILHGIDTQDLSYCAVTSGASDVVFCPIPAYVLNRYFPKFKGFSRLSNAALQSILFQPRTLYRYGGFFSVAVCTADIDFRLSLPLTSLSIIDDYAYTFSLDEIQRIVVRIENCKKRFIALTGLNEYDFVYYYLKAWSILDLTRIRLSLQSVDCFSNFSDYYINVADYEDLSLVSPTLSSLDCEVDYNKLSDVVSKNINLRTLYYQRDKQKRVSNLIMSKKDYV